MRVNLSETGFTLVELLVTISIVLLISVGSVTAYLTYRDKRVAQDDANAVAERLRTIQTKASAVEIPGGCTAVDNYAVTINGASLTVTARCIGGATVSLPDLTLTLTNSVFSAPVTITFDTQTFTASPASINICGYKNLYRVDVNAAANVGKPVYVGSC